MPNEAQLQTLNSVGGTLTKLAPATGPAAPFVALGGAIVSAISSLIPPRGNYAKFKRTAYPYWLQKAQQTGLPVLGCWFNGEVVGVSPNGTFGVVAAWELDGPMGKGKHPHDSGKWIEPMRMKGSFIEAGCVRDDNNCPNNPAGYLYTYHEKIGLTEDTTKLISKVPSLVWLGLIVFLFWRFK
jgi:hypothetical protein